MAAKNTAKSISNTPASTTPASPAKSDSGTFAKVEIPPGYVLLPEAVVARLLTPIPPAVQSRPGRAVRQMLPRLDPKVIEAEGEKVLTALRGSPMRIGQLLKATRIDRRTLVACLTALRTAKKVHKFGSTKSAFYFTGLPAAPVPRGV